jgi:hypothetical protein
VVDREALLYEGAKNSTVQLQNHRPDRTAADSAMASRGNHNQALGRRSCEK